MAADGSAPPLPMLTIQFCSAAAACTAEGLCLPVNLIKVRMQLSATPVSIVETAVAASRERGFFGLWRGLSPALSRQLVYGQLRIGLYHNFATRVNSTPQKLAVGAASGAAAAALANPFDLLMVRMQATNAASAARRQGMLDALRDLVRDRGAAALWTGVTPTVVRAAVVTATEQTSYDIIKTRLRAEFGFRDALPLHTLASFAAGLLVVLITSPVDVIKTTAFTAATAATPVETTRTIWREHGLLGFYRGFVPYWLRMGPWSTVMFLSLEEYKRLARRCHGM